jgi:hypothetical protein
MGTFFLIAFIALPGVFFAVLVPLFTALLNSAGTGLGWERGFEYFDSATYLMPLLVVSVAYCIVQGLHERRIASLSTNGQGRGSPRTSSVPVKAQKTSVDQKSLDRGAMESALKQ